MFDWIRRLRQSPEERLQHQIGSYLDGDLQPDDQREFERQLTEDAPLRQQVMFQQAIVRAMRDMPARRAPRNFTLTLEMVGATPPQRSWVMQPVLQTGLALAAIMLMAVGAFNLSGAGMLPTQDLAMEPVVRMEESADTGAIMDVQAESAPMAVEDQAEGVEAVEGEAVAVESFSVEVTRVVTDRPAVSAPEEETMEAEGDTRTADADQVAGDDAEAGEAVADVAVAQEEIEVEVTPVVPVMVTLPVSDTVNQQDDGAMEAPQPGPPVETTLDESGLPTGETTLETTPFPTLPPEPESQTLTRSTLPGAIALGSGLFLLLLSLWMWRQRRII